MHQININTKMFSEAVTIDLGQLPTVDTRIDFILTDGSNPVIAENKTFSMTIGTVLGSLYKTDNDTVSFRYLKFNDDNIADSLAIRMKMNGEEILNDVVSLKYQTSGGIDSSALDKKLDAPATPGTAGQVLTKTADGQEWADAPAGGVDADTMQAIEDLSVMLDGHTGISTDTTNYLRLVATKNNHVISIGGTGFTGNDVSLEYSIDKIHWFEFNPVTTVKSVALNAGQCMYLRGNNNSKVLATNGDSAFFGDYIIDGDMKSLWSKTLEPEYTLTSCSYWFRNCGIVGFGNNFVTPDLSHVTTMNSMFEYASLLTTLPANFSIPIGVTDCNNMFNQSKTVSIPVGFTIPNGVTNVKSMLAGCFVEEIPALPASVVNASWYASYGKGSSSPSRLAAGFKFPEGCTECTYALYDRCISSLPDGFTIPSSITDDGRAFQGNNPLTTVGNNVSFLKQNASWSKDYIPYNTITTIGDNFTLLCNNAPSTDPYVCFPNLTSLGTNCNINGTITNPA